MDLDVFILCEQSKPPSPLSGIAGHWQRHAIRCNEWLEEGKDRSQQGSGGINEEEDKEQWNGMSVFTLPLSRFL